MGTKTLLTLEQFGHLPIKEGILYEINEGELVIKTEPKPGHNRVHDNIARHLGNFVEERRLGWVLVENGYQLSPDIVRIPDASFVPAERLPGLDLNKRMQDAPARLVGLLSQNRRGVSFPC